MNKKLIALFSLLVILAFIGYIIYDATTEPKAVQEPETVRDTVYDDSWKVNRVYHVTDGSLTSVAVSANGIIVLGGDSMIKSLDRDLMNLWSLKTEKKVTSLAVSGDTIFAATQETILLISTAGKTITEWGPYESNSIITSVSAGRNLVAFADAGNKRVFILKKNGEVSSMAGQSEDKFVIPSPYFDVALSGNLLFAANTGQHRIETWTTEGKKLSSFGEPGIAPGAFCGCCSPPHFAVIPQGFVTAEKGINRIKILAPDGRFIEFVSSANKFIRNIPLDVASADGRTIYAANPSDSTLYEFIRK